MSDQQQIARAKLKEIHRLADGACEFRLATRARIRTLAREALAALATGQAGAPERIAALEEDDGSCRDGGPHYCPNCDNSFFARTKPAPQAGEEPR